MSQAIASTAAAAVAPATKAVKRVDTAHDLASDSASLASSLGRGCSSVGSFDDVPSDRTPSLSGSDAVPDTHAVVNPRKTHQRAQRLLVRVPSTGAVVVVESAMLFFGKHKQRGKPLTLCPAFDCADPSAAVCHDAANCNCVHADVRLASLFQPHQRSAAMFGQYPRMRGSELVEVTRDDDSGVDRVPPGSVLITRAQEAVRRPLRHCAHFLSGKCNRGSECEFAHVVPTMGSTPAAPATKATAPAAVHSHKESSSLVAANDRSKTARSTPAPATQVDVGVRRSSPASPVVALPPPVLPGHHAMPAWRSAYPAHCVPSAASVVSSSWQTLA